MEKSKGWVAIWRKIDNSEIWLQEPWRLKTWLYLIMQANHEERARYGWKLKRGQVYISSLADLCDKIRWKNGFASKKPTVNAMKQFWEWLRRHGMVDTKKTTRGTVVTILNYAQYQDILPKSVDTREKPLVDTAQTPATSHDRQPREQLNKKQDITSLSKFELLEAYKNRIRDKPFPYKPFFNGDPLVWSPDKEKWYAIKNGDWLAFVKENANIEKIEWRPKN